MCEKINVGIVGTGIYIPEHRMTAAEIAAATNGIWSEEAVAKKLGIVEKSIPGPGMEDGTQEMGAKAALDCLPMLKNCEAHSSVIVSHVDSNIFRKLALNLTCEPVYETKKLFHR